MASKLTINISHIDPKRPNGSAMAQTIGLLSQLIDLPSGGLKLTINCENEDLDGYLDDVMDTLSHRPVGIKVEWEKQEKGEIERATVASVTPMDKAGWN